MNTATKPELEAFINAFRRHAAGVAVITTLNADGSPAGFTATSLASLSATPPMATFNLATTSSSWPAICDGEWVAIHILGSNNQNIAKQFAGPQAKRFSGGITVEGPHGLQIAPEASAILICRIVARNVIGKAASVAVRIEQGIFNDPEEPLLYHERAYHRLTPLD